MRILIFNALLLGVAAYALWRGGAPERIVAILFLASAGASIAVAVPGGAWFSQPAYGLLALDLLLLLALVLVALCANRVWPMTMAALQLILVGIHAVRIVNTDTVGWVYAVMLGLWSYPMLVLLAVGTVRHRRRLRENGIDKPWSASSFPWRLGSRKRSPRA